MTKTTSSLQPRMRSVEAATWRLLVTAKSCFLRSSSKEISSCLLASAARAPMAAVRQAAMTMISSMGSSQLPSIRAYFSSRSSERLIRACARSSSCERRRARSWASPLCRRSTLAQWLHCRRQTCTSALPSPSQKRSTAMRTTLLRTPRSASVATRRRQSERTVARSPSCWPRCHCRSMRVVASCARARFRFATVTKLDTSNAVCVRCAERKASHFARSEAMRSSPKFVCLACSAEIFQESMQAWSNARSSPRRRRSTARCTA
mmetsp:Transcript_58907/g.149247  ORF Transcript_58907/g.149247 Transcript_58907/m.149247 type:complete len:263 (-) Transcript_58907:1789-2577(-)